MSKKVLVVFSDNFIARTKGCDAYCYMVFSCLKSQGVLIDQVSFLNKEQYGYDCFNDINQKDNIINNLYLFGEQNPDVGGVHKNSEHFSMPKRKFFLKSKKKNNNSYMNLPEEKIKIFESIINENQYDVINIHHIFNVDFILGVKIPEKTKLLYTMHDNHFIQNYYHNFNINLGFEFNKELSNIKLFHEVYAISYDEMSFWSKFCPNLPFTFLPHTSTMKDLSMGEKKIDILFLGHCNIFNVQGVIWFIDNVYEHLDKSIKITICGRVLEKLRNENPDDYAKLEKSNISFIEFAPNLEDVYQQTKVVIVPMIQGTGMKIKTIESMSYNIPVVSTVLGVDGFPDKFENGCLVSDDPMEFAQNISRLLVDKDFYDSVKYKQKAYFEKYFSLSANEKKLDKLFNL